MKLNYNIAVLIIIFSISACTAPKSSVNTIPDSHNSQNSLDWEGVYTGTIPCADCKGIRTMIDLSKNMTYVMETKYQGKSEEIFRSNGSFSWDKSGSYLIMNKESGKPSYKVGENILFVLDSEGKLITGNLANNYTLTKETNTLTEKYWKLIEINGKTVKSSEKEAHFILKAADNRITGNSGCNSFAGSFEQQPGNRISFSKIASTRMACMDMSIEDQLFNILSTIDNFSLNEGILSLNRARMAPLARFEVVYLK